MTDGIFVFTSANCTTTNAVFNTSGTGQAIKGYIEKVVFKSTSWANGSIFLTDVTTGETIYGTGNVSGTAAIVYYPRVYVTDNLGASQSGTNAAGWDRRYINGPVQVSGLGLGSTAAGTVGTVTVFYSAYE